MCESEAGWNEFMSGTRQRQLHTAGTGQLFAVASLVSVQATLICKLLLYNELLRRLHGDMQ